MPCRGQGKSPEVRPLSTEPPFIMEEKKPVGNPRFQLHLWCVDFWCMLHLES